MAKLPVFKLSLSALVAAAITVGAYCADIWQVESHARAAGLRFARQIAAQAESMALSARNQGEKDPLGWAVDYLAQGVEPRVIQIARTNGDDDASGQLGESEAFRLDRKAGLFEYVKTIELLGEGGGKPMGVRVQVDLGYSGFLGSFSRLSNDFTLIAFFVFWMGFTMLALTRRAAMANAEASPEEPSLESLPPLSVVAPPAASSSPKKPARAPSSRSKEAKLRASVLNWLGGARASLTSLGVSTRDIIKQAQVMAAAARNSLGATEALREKVHGGLRDLHSSRQALRGTAELLAQLEALAQSPQAEEILARLKSACAAGDQALKTIELQIEPWALEADLAFEAHANVLQATKEMGDCIQKAKDQLVGQAKIMNELNTQLAPESAEASVASETGETPDFAGAALRTA